MKALKRWTKGQWAVIFALVLLLLVVNVAFAISLLMNNPFDGSIYDAGGMSITSVMVSDDGVADGIPPCPGWDCSEVAFAGMDPTGLKASASPWDETRAVYDVQYCDASINGGNTVNVTMTDTQQNHYCAIRLMIQNDNTTDTIEYMQAIVNGAPIDVADEPACGAVAITPGNTGVVVLQLTPNVAALPGEVWNSGTASIDVEFGIAGTYVCPP